MRMKANRRKQRHQNAVPLNLTLPPLLHAKMFEIISAHGYRGPSEFLGDCIRANAGLVIQKFHAQETA